MFTNFSPRNLKSQLPHQLNMDTIFSEQNSHSSFQSGDKAWLSIHCIWASPHPHPRNEHRIHLLAIRFENTHLGHASVHKTHPRVMTENDLEMSFARPWHTYTSAEEEVEDQTLEVSKILRRDGAGLIMAIAIVLCDDTRTATSFYAKHRNRLAVREVRSGNEVGFLLDCVKEERKYKDEGIQHLS